MQNARFVMAQGMTNIAIYVRRNFMSEEQLTVIIGKQTEKIINLKNKLAKAIDIAMELIVDIEAEVLTDNMKQYWKNKHKQLMECKDE